MFLSATLLLMVTVLPGYALCRVLDASADRTRKIALSPALGLLLAYGISGLVLLSGLWTWGLMSAILLLLNSIAIVQIRRKTSSKKALSSWQKLERAMHGEVYGIVDEKISDEVAAQRWLQNQRKPWMMCLAASIVVSCLSLPFLVDIPFGVDWIGFSTLTQRISLVGDLTLSGTNTGFWTYPPAFPSLAAWLQESLNLSSSTAVFHLGHYSLAVLILGIGGAMDRHGAGAHAILAVALGAGLFAKTFDSGYPTVASQLGLVVGLLVLLRPTSTRGKHHTTGFVLAFLCVMLIHPTGATYLGMFMMAHLLIGLSLNETYGENIKKLLLASSILLTVAAAIALLILAPRMLDAAVFAEYGWQGGRPMLMYNGILLIIGLCSGWMLRKTIEGRLLIAWFTGLWILTAIHLVEGLEQIPVLSLLSYTLYSMGLHAFHIPLVALVALWWSDSTCLTTLEETRSLLTVGWDPHMHRYMTAALSVSILIGVVAGNAVLVQVSQHEELKAYSSGDFEVFEHISTLPEGSIIYTENTHWGYVIEHDGRAKTTSIPSLGLIQVEKSIQSQATSAVFSDSIAKILELNITHALSSPLGTVGWVLAQSPYWIPIYEVKGSVMWQLDSTGRAPVSHFSTFDLSSCSESCSVRVDPWIEHRFRDPINIGKERAFIEEGSSASIQFQSQSTGIGTMCIGLEAIGKVDDVEIQISTLSNSSQESFSLTTGWNSLCFEEEFIETAGELELNWLGKTEDSHWLNPLGLSGRGDALLDSTGIRLHWIEIKQNPVL